MLLHFKHLPFFAFLDLFKQTNAGDLPSILIARCVDGRGGRDSKVLQEVLADLKKYGVKKCLEICAIKGGRGRSTPNGKYHLKFPF